MLKVEELNRLAEFGFREHLFGNTWYKEVKTNKDELNVEIIVDKKTHEIYINAMNDKNLQNAYYVFDSDLSNEDRPSDYLEEGYITSSSSETNIDLELIFDLIVAGVVVKC